MRRFSLSTCALLVLSACGGPGSAEESASPPTSTGDDAPTAEASAAAPESPPRQPPPESAAPRDVRLPSIARTTLRNGLEVNVVTADRLPIVYARLVVKSGLAADPANLPGLSSFVANMLEEGTATKSSAEVAEAIESIGASLTVQTEADAIALTMRAPADMLEPMLAILAEVVTRPAFAPDEIARLRAREQDRLAVTYADPANLARREFFRLAYGSHPYAHIDLTPATLAAVTRNDLVSWHRAHFVPSNAFLVLVGDVTEDRARRSVERTFGNWRGAAAPRRTFPPIPERTGRQILLVHRPGSVQSVIAVGHPTIPRAHPDFLALEVTNQVLGGSPASRLFMDLRERRSLTYGAYSSVDERADASPFRARAAVPNSRTAPAMDGFMEHLERIVSEAAPPEEVEAATRYLSDSFPLQIDTFGRVAWMVSFLRLFGLPDEYWDSYRSQIRAVTAEQALAAARGHIHPDRAVVVVVGDANVVFEPLSRWGSVEVVDTSGQPLRDFRASDSP